MSSQVRTTKTKQAIFLLGILLAFLLASSHALAMPSPNPVPYVNGLSPVSVRPGGADFTLTVNGFNFVSGSTVYWGQTALATTYVNSDQLTATVTASLIAGGGSGWITVQSPAPGGGISNLVFLPVASPTTTLTMANFSYSTTGTYPFALAQGDFNGDGKLDIVASNYGSGNISVFLGNGDGTFQTPVTYAAGSSPWGIAVGDVNGDGKLDLVVGQAEGNTLAVLLGNGDGTFQAPQMTGSGLSSGYYNPVLVDVNRDGYLDVLIPEYDNGTVALYLGNGDGTFQARQQAASLGSGYEDFELSVGDFNGDGYVDFSVGSYGGNTYVVLGNGDGTFQAPQPLASPDYCWITVAGDVNNDGKLDYACGNEDNPPSASYAGNGDGTFQAYTALSLGDGSTAMTLGDLNADGKLDIISKGWTNATTVMLGNGDGTFQDPITFQNTGYSYQILAGNYATGGGLGIATVDYSSGNLILLLQTVSLTPSSYDFGSVGEGVASSPQTFTLTNSTSNSVTTNGISFTGTNSSDFSQTNNCPESLASGSSCTIQVTFTPSGSGSRSATLSVSDNAPASPQTSVLTGTGVISAVASFSTTSLSFGNQGVGTTSTAQTTTLTNTGTGTLVISSIATSGANAGDYHESDNCGGSVAPSASCTISVTFTPAAQGASSASLVVTDNAADSSQSIALSGSGTQASASLSTGSLTFGNTMVASTSDPQTVTLTNSGNVALTISSVAVSGTNASDFNMTNNCGASLAASASCTISVTFKPAAEGARSATITVTDNGTPATQSVTLGGTGTQASASLSTTSLTFGSTMVTSTSDPQTVTLTNSGNVTLTISSVTVSGTNASDFNLTNNCGASLAASASCTISVTFKPTAGGTRTATITFNDSAAPASQTVTLSGTGEDFTMSTPSAQTVAAGGSASFQMQLAPQGGFNQTVSLACANATALMTCAVTPSSVTLNGAASNVTITVTTAGNAVATPMSEPQTRFPSWPLTMLCAVIAFGLFLVKERARLTLALQSGLRPVSGMVLAGMLLLASIGMVACNATTTARTVAGTYQVTITATSGNIQHSTTVQVTVQ